MCCVDGEWHDWQEWGASAQHRRLRLLQRLFPTCYFTPLDTLEVLIECDFAFSMSRCTAPCGSGTLLKRPRTLCSRRCSLWHSMNFNMNICKLSILITDVPAHDSQKAHAEAEKLKYCATPTYYITLSECLLLASIQMYIHVQVTGQ